MPQIRLPRAALAAAIVFALSLPVSAAEFTESARFSSDELVVRNLVGEVTVSRAEGDEFIVEVRVQGRDADRDVIAVSVERGRSAALNVIFPVDRHDNFVYPEMQGSASFSMQNHEEGGGGFWSKVFGWSRNRVHVSGSGRGLEVWADIDIAVPDGAALAVEHGAGRIVATDASGDLDLRISTGRLEAARLRGNINLDTGSGSVTAEDISGELVVDTGSGDVRLARCVGASLLVDTGSGSVHAEDVSADRVKIDTGSGRVVARRVEADTAVIDTGSGSVELALARMGPGRFKIDTGSGRIDLKLPPDASAEVSAETGSGGIHVDLQDIRVSRKDRDEMVFTVGGGAASVVLDTGSGGIRIAGLS